MIAKLWEIAILLIVLSLASKLVLANLAPLIPVLIVGLVVTSIVGSLYSKKKRW